MGSKFSKAVRRPPVVSEAVASTSPATATSDTHQTEPRQDSVLPDIKCDEPLVNDTTADAVATSPISHDNPPADNDVDAMEIETAQQHSTDSITLDPERAPEVLPGDVVENEPPTPPESPPQALSCLICCTAFPKDKEDQAIVPCRCGNVYCGTCLKNMFVDACKDLTRMPPRCCTQLPLHVARPHLTQEEAALFRAKYEEWSTPNPFYCPVARCSAFIPNRLLPQTRTNNKGKQRADSGIGTPTAPVVSCPNCETEICASCRAFAHADASCSPLEFGIDKETIALLQAWGYKRCPKCGNGVKRMFGCNHMECRCGAHFCWVCLKNRDNGCDGGCYDEDEYDSDDEPDQEESDEEETNEEETNDDSQPTITITTNTDTPAGEEEATTDAAVAQSVEGTAETQDSANTESASPQPTPRVRNLDGGSGRYWEEQDLDFGDEPTNDVQDRAWECSHNFKTAKVSLADSLRNAPSAVGMECMKCWGTIHPEIEMPNSINTGGSRTVSSAARGHSTRGRGRGRGRGRLAMNTARNPFLRAPVPVLGTSAPQFTTQSQGSLFSEVMEGIEQTSATAVNNERVVDTYGNTITTTERLSESRRTSIDIFDFSNEDLLNEDPDWRRALKPTCGAVNIPPKPVDHFHTHLNLSSSPFSFAYECQECGLFVCNTCKENILAAREEDESMEDGSDD